MGVTLPWPGLSEGRGRYMRAHAGRGRPLAIDTAHTSTQHIGPMGGLHGRGGRGCGGIPCHHENLGPLGVPGSRMPVQPPGARTSGSLPRARPNLGLHAYLRPAHALQLCVEHGCKGDNMSLLSTAVQYWYCIAVLCVTSTREAYRLVVNVVNRRQAFAVRHRSPRSRELALP